MTEKKTYKFLENINKRCEMRASEYPAFLPPDGFEPMVSGEVSGARKRAPEDFQPRQRYWFENLNIGECIEFQNKTSYKTALAVAYTNGKRWGKRFAGKWYEGRGIGIVSRIA